MVKIQTGFLHNMKRKKKSALFRICGLLFFSAVASGCADADMPSWVTGEPDRNYLESHRVIAKPERFEGALEAGDSWPSLADVPRKPQDVMSRKEREAAISDMEDARQDGEALKGKLEEDAPLLEAVEALREPSDLR